MAEFYAGKLLVATPKLLDPNFFRTVVLICSHDENGALGLILNRPIEEVDVGEHLPEWRPLAASPEVVFAGGPVEPSAAMALASPAPAGPILDGLGLADLSRSPGELSPGPRTVRVFAGYSGWAAGQLEAEVADDAWFVVDARPGDVFSNEPGRLWHTVLRRQRGELGMYAFFPPDPAAN